MAGFGLALAAGLAGGLAASWAMNLYQGATAGLFGQGSGGGEPATEKAADDLAGAAGQGRLAKAERKTAGMAVHYAAGAALGLGYGALVWAWPAAAIGFGLGFGLAVSLILDNTIVPLLGWGKPPWAVDARTHAFAVTSHLVFGVAAEAVRRLVVALLG